MRHIRFWAHFLKGAVAEEMERFFPSSGKKCDIDFPEKWKRFSTCRERVTPYTEQFIGNTPWIEPFHFFRHSDC
jgi:hypothetical protein